MASVRDASSSLQEYEKLLENSLCAPIIEGLISIREQAQEIADGDTASESMSAVAVTKELLRQVKSWTQVLLEEETRRVTSKIPYLQQLLTATFIFKVKVLSCITLRSDATDYPLEIPSNTTYIHQVYLHAANLLIDNDVVIDEMRVSQLAPLVKEAISRATLACIRWDDFFKWWLAGMSINDAMKAATAPDDTPRAAASEGAEAEDDDDDNNGGMGIGGASGQDDLHAHDSVGGEDWKADTADDVDMDDFKNMANNEKTRSDGGESSNGRAGVSGDGEREGGSSILESEDDAEGDAEPSADDGADEQTKTPNTKRISDGPEGSEASFFEN